MEKYEPPSNEIWNACVLELAQNMSLLATAPGQAPSATCIPSIPIEDPPTMPPRNDVVASKVAVPVTFKFPPMKSLPRCVVVA